MKSKLQRILSLVLVFSIIVGNVMSVGKITFADESEVAAEQESINFKYEHYKDGISITGYNGKVPHKLVIPREIEGNRVLSIGDEAFKNKGIEKLELPEGLEKIGYMSFQKNGISIIKLPSTLIELGKRSFAYNQIEYIEFSESMDSIGYEAFMNNKLESIEIPEHIKEIQQGAFNNNELIEVVINEGLEVLGNKAFEDNLLEKVNIPDTVTSWPNKKDNPVFRRNNNKNGGLNLVRIYNNSGASSENTFGIVNPSEVTLMYQDENGNEILKSKSIVGIEHKTLEEYDVSSYKTDLRVIDGNKEGIVDYSAPFGYNTVNHLKELEDNYFMQGKEYTFEAENIKGYSKPESQTRILNDKKNTIVFSYESENTEDNANLSDLREEALTWSLANNEKLDVDKAMIILASELGVEDIRHIINEHKIYMGYNAKPLNTIRNFILGNDMECLEEVKNYDFTTKLSSENDINNHINSMLALNLLEEVYNVKTANESLIDGIISGKVADKHIVSAISLISDSTHSIDKLSLLKNINDRLIKKPGNLESYTSLLGGYALLDGDLESEEFKSGMEYVYGCKKIDKEGYSTTPGNTWRQSEQELYALRLFLILENRESIFKTAAKKIDRNPANKNEYKIEIDKSKFEFKEFDDIKLDVKTFLNNKEMDLAYEIISDNTDVLLVGNDNKIIVNNSGQAKLKFVLKEDKKAFDEINLNIEKVEVKSGQGNINNFIDAISIYYNRDHFKDNGGKLTAFEYATFEKGGLSTSRWEVEKDYKPSYDENLKYVGNKARQVEIMLATGRNPRDYKGRDLISEIVDVLNSGKSEGRNFDFAAYPYLLGAVAVNNYNDMFSDNKVSYDENKVINMIKAAQQANGGLIERSIENGIAPRNTALALEVVTKISGGNDVKTKILSYFESIQQNNGGFFEKAYITNYNADIVKALSIAGEDLTSSKWTKGEYNPIESIFYLYRDNNSFKDFVGEDMSTLNNPNERDLDCKVATQAALEALIEIRKDKANYPVKTARISEVKEILEQEIEINTSIIVLDKEGKVEVKNNPSKLKLNNRKHTAGLTALGALQATTDKIKMNYGFVEEIQGIRNSGNGGWVYSVNDQVPNLAAAYTNVKDNDNILWVYIPEELLKDKQIQDVVPKWEILIESENKEILEEISKIIPSNLKKDMDSDSDGNVLEILDNIIKAKGYSGVELKLLSVDRNDEFASIDEVTGNIKYFYKHPSEVKGLYSQQRTCTIELKLGEDTKIIELRPSIFWDKKQVRKVIEEEIMEDFENQLKGDNNSLSEFKSDVSLKDKMGSKGYDYLEVNYELENNGALKYEKGGYDKNWKPMPSKLIVKNIKEPVRTKLKVTFKMVQQSTEVMTKEYDITVLPKDYSGPTLEEAMQEKLNKDYTEDKFSCSVTGEKIDLEKIVNDIKIPTPKETGIEDYDNYKYFMTSSDEDIIKPFETKNAGKVVVYRPLPGNEAKKATLTINMEDKKSGTIVSKKLKEITVLPLTNEEIEKEIELMEKVKSNYFEIIKGENTSKDEITKDLKWFREVNFGKDGLAWNTHIKDDVNMGITPDALEGWYDTEEWRIFRSSNPEVITNENLLVTRPLKDSEVKIDSILTSVIYGKYAEKYPNDERFKKLYKQPVSVEVTVLGAQENSIDLDKEINFLKSVFNAYMEEDSNGNTGNAKLSLTGTGAARLAGMDNAKIQKNIYIDKDNKTAYQLSQSIITLVGAELDPTNYNGRNLVDELVKSQQKDGDFVTEYRGVGEDLNSIEAQIRSIIALDLVGAKYNEDEAIEKLISMYGNKDSKTYKEIETEGYMLLALSNHRNKKAVEGNIMSITIRLSNAQKEDGTFTVKGIGNGGTIAMARVVQGLVANGIDPLTDKRFIKNGNTIVDGILRNKVEKPELKKSGYSKKANDSNNYAAGTHLVFGALLDVKNQESMFKILSKIVESDTIKVNLVITKFNSDGKYEVMSKPQVVEINKEKYNGKVTVTDALVESGIGYKAKGSMITEIMGLGETKEEGSTSSGWMFTLNGVFPEKNGIGLAADQALIKDGDNIVWSRIFNYDNDVLPTMEEIKSLNTNKLITIDIPNEIELGKELEIVAKDENGNIIENKEVLYLVSNGEFAEVIEGKIITKKAGKFTVTASLKEDKNVKTTVNIQVVNKSLEELDLGKYINNIRTKYDTKEKLSFREALGYRYTSNDLEKDLNLIGKKIELREMDTANNIATNIISIIAAGENPYSYKGINYVELLQNQQQNDGKFIKDSDDDYASTQAFAVMALDMSKASYKENTVDMLLSYQNNDGSFSDWKDADTAAMVITALGNHMDNEDLSGKLEKSIEFIKSKLEEANVYTLSATVQGLISVGEDIKSDKWNIGGKEITDVLIEKYELALKDMFKPGQSDMLDEQVFIALSDAYKGKSMFKEIRVNKNEVVKIEIKELSTAKLVEGDTIQLEAIAKDSQGNIVRGKEFSWTVSDKSIATIDGNGNLVAIKDGEIVVEAELKDSGFKVEKTIKIFKKEFEVEVTKPGLNLNQEAKSKAKIKNLTNEDKSVILIIALFNKETDEIINYATVENILKPGEEMKLESGLLVPKSGKFEIKTFLWDSLDKGNPIKIDKAA